MVTVFTEAGYQIGFGHFYRMSGICDRLFNAGIQIRMVLKADQDARNNLNRPYVQVIPWQTSDAISQLIEPDDVVIIDSYQVGMDVLEAAQKLAKKLIVIDDNMRLPYEGMSVLNPNYYAVYMDYPRDKGNTYYLGKDYTLLREPFTRPFQRIVNSEVNNILITMGGTDPRGVTLKIIRYINTIRSNETKLSVVATAAYKELDEIKRSLADRDTCFENLTAEEMCQLMKKADIAVATAGGTSNELIRMQCPSALIQVADNQKNNVNLMKRAGFVEVFDLDHMDIIGGLIPMKKRSEMIARMRTVSSDRTAADLILGLI